MLAAVMIAWLAGPAAAQSIAEQALAILQANCVQCHGGPVAMSGLQLTSREALLKGGVHGPAVIPGEARNGLTLPMKYETLRGEIAYFHANRPPTVA